jgi:crotonobetainyl-CoA:carnitine CoA-transferase CaiB-like acyl-CoA transferase
LYATVGILAALAYRERTGEGQHIDVALLDVQVATLANQAANHLVGGTVPGRMGNAHPNIVPYQDFPTADGHMIVAVGNDSQFAQLCEEAGCPWLASDPRYTRNRDRVANRADLAAELSEWTRTRGTASWVTALDAAGVPCGPINTIDQVFADPQVRSREMRIDLPDSVAGTVPLVANPLRLSASPVRYDSAPPALGAHTHEVLAGLLGLQPTHLRALADSGVIQTQYNP